MVDVIRHSGPVNSYVFADGTNIQDQGDVGRWTALQAQIASGTVTVINYEDTDEYTNAQAAGLASIERNWITGQLNLMRETIEDLQDRNQPMNGIQAIIAYRILLRAWPDHASFPDSNFRPVGP